MTNLDIKKDNDLNLYYLDDSNLEIDLKEIFFILRNRYKLIILTTLLIGILALFNT